MSDTLTLRGVPAEVRRTLRASARRAGRSVNREAVLWLCERASQNLPSEAQLLERIRARKMTTRLTAVEIRSAMRKGRA
jgi:hypothetical protein